MGEKHYGSIALTVDQNWLWAGRFVYDAHSFQVYLITGWFTKPYQSLRECHFEVISLSAAVFTMLKS